jgi:2-polyprenyl-3-methyl-5-hydroxy-6-metoxy-1,4-benzoquinol methylase
VDQSARARAGTRAQIVLLEQDGAQAAHNSVSRNARAGNAPADDQQVCRLFDQLLQRGPLGGSASVTLPPVSRVPRPSTWFVWYGHLIRPGMRVLDLACGEGRHSLAAAAAGAEVIGLDRDEARLATARELAAAQGLSVDWRTVDLEGPWPDLGCFDAVLDFNYLDRARMPRILELVGPGGILMMESFLAAQRELGWGPTADDHLLQPGEISQLVAPLRVVHGREVLEAIDAERWRAVASVVAQRSQQ